MNAEIVLDDNDAAPPEPPLPAGNDTSAADGVASLPFDALVKSVVTIRTSPRREWIWQRLLGSRRSKIMRPSDYHFTEGSIWNWQRMQAKQRSVSQ